MSSGEMEAVILAAGRGSRLGEVGKSIPKGLLEVNGEKIVESSIHKLNSLGVERITLVVGHCAEHYYEYLGSNPNIKFILNANYKDTGSFESLRLGLSRKSKSVLILDADIIYEARGLEQLLESSSLNAILASGPTNSKDEVWVSKRGNRLVKLSKDLPVGKNEPLGEFVGITKLNSELVGLLVNLYDQEPKRWSKSEYESALSNLALSQSIFVESVGDLLWGEIDTVEHLNRVRELFRQDVI
jgi:2-aminoethylphosphonate-pyruvate transaminase